MQFQTLLILPILDLSRSTVVKAVFGALQRGTPGYLRPPRTYQFVVRVSTTYTTNVKVKQPENSVTCNTFNISILNCQSCWHLFLTILPYDKYRARTHFCMQNSRLFPYNFFPFPDSRCNHDELQTHSNCNAMHTYNSK